MRKYAPFEEALEIVLSNASTPSPSIRSLADCAGCRLEEEVVSDIDMPPFDRSAVDGYALAGEGESFTLTGSVSAGDARSALERGSACFINTGAPIPEGADRVLMVERSRVEGGRVVPESATAPGENICRRGEDVRSGEVVLQSGTILHPQHVGIAAMAGRGALRVSGRPRPAVLVTGNELVPWEEVPGPSGVRDANTPLLQSLLSGNGFSAAAFRHACDAESATSAAAGELLAAGDALIVAGGISMGDRDHVAPALEAAGVRLLLRDVAIKPGKPFSFGLFGRKPVFALPGNPVSVLCTFHLFVLPALRTMSGLAPANRTRLPGVARFEERLKAGRMNFLRVTAMRGEGVWILGLPPSSGSGDLRSTRDANALAVVPPERSSVSRGDVLEFIPLEPEGFPSP